MAIQPFTKESTILQLSRNWLKAPADCHHHLRT
jgi:hypothetical protein